MREDPAMPDLPAAELRAMARSIDASMEPRVRLELDLSAEGAQRLHDMLTAVTNDLSAQAGIEATWPLHRMLGALEEVAARSAQEQP